MSSSIKGWTGSAVSGTRPMSLGLQTAWAWAWTWARWTSRRWKERKREGGLENSQWYEPGDIGGVCSFSRLTVVFFLFADVQQKAAQVADRQSHGGAQRAGQGERRGSTQRGRRRPRHSVWGGETGQERHAGNGRKRVIQVERTEEHLSK